MRCQLARRLWESGRTDETAAELAGALVAARLLADGERDKKLHASALEFCGMLASIRGDWTAAAADFTRSRDLHHSIPNPYGVALQEYRLGEAEAALGHHDAASLLLTEVHEALAGLKRERMTARSGFALGHLLHASGRTQEARRLYQAALDGALRRGSAFE